VRLKLKKMFLYISAIFVIFISHFLWKNRFLFNTDFSKNFEKEGNIPLMKNGIPFAMMTTGMLNTNLVST